MTKVVLIMNSLLLILTGGIIQHLLRKTRYVITKLHASLPILPAFIFLWMSHSMIVSLTFLLFLLHFFLLLLLLLFLLLLLTIILFLLILLLLFLFLILSLQPIAGSTGTWTGFGNDRDTVTNIAYITLIEDLTKN